MSFCGGEYLDHKKAKQDHTEGGMISYLGTSAGMAEDTYGGLIPGEFIHITAPNAKTQIMIDTPLGKGTGMFLGFLWQMRKKGFHIQKVSEAMEISPVHSQYYQLTIQQKQTLEGQIKTALTGVQTAISDYELISHDMRRYREYMNYFENIERGKKEKDADLEKRNVQTLKSLFIDQVDVHTGEGVALKLIASRWPTIIVDFMKIGDKDEDPKKIAKDYGFSEAEGVVLATKNKIFNQWRDLFKESVKSRWQHLKELMEARKRSIEEYRNMAKPYIMRYKMIREMGETAGGRAVLKSFSWSKPAAQALSWDSAEYWMWRPFWPPEIHRPSLQRNDEDVSITGFNLPEFAKQQLIESNKDKKKTLKVFPTGIEPVDKWVWFFKDEMVKYYKIRENFKSDLTAQDVLKARQELSDQFVEYGRWDWLPSPYFMCLEVDLFRIVQRNPDGTESETLIIGDYPRHPLMAIFNTQNAILVRLLELKLQHKELERYITDMIGETAEGEKAEDLMKENYPYLSGVEPEKKKKENKVVEKINIDKTRLQRYIRFTRGGPYHTSFMERIAAMMLKEIGQSTYAYTTKYFKSAAGVP